MLFLHWQIVIKRGPSGFRLMLNIFFSERVIAEQRLVSLVLLNPQGAVVAMFKPEMKFDAVPLTKTNNFLPIIL